MASFQLGSGVHGGQTLGELESGFVGKNASILELTTTGVSGGGTNIQSVSLTVHGEISAIDYEAVNLHAFGVYLYLGQTATVSSQGLSANFAAITVTTESQAVIFNEGWISGGGNGIDLFVENDVAVVRMQNSGTIQGVSAGLGLQGTSIGGTVLIENSGTVTGGFAGIVMEDDPALVVAATIDNSGLIRGAVVSIALGTGADLVTNTGRIEGDAALGGGDDRLVNSGAFVGEVVLGSGNDVLDTRTGTTFAVLQGNQGNDRFLLNAGHGETVDGGSGIDTVEFFGPLGAIVALDGSFENAGAADGDSFVGVERLTGTNGGADMLRGNSGSNLFLGRGGSDTLDGAGGTDTLQGGNGIDVLTGGLGNDSFRFNTLADCGDTITDFTNLTGNNDRMQFAGAAFGGIATGTLTAALFQSRADNVAQDADDRFIFRTTDKTVWFDADGNGTGAAVLVADLQDSATFSRLDILIL